MASKNLRGESGLSVSSATVRNIMSELEDRGFLASPHTSAGRVPTAQGYRFFVDSLLQVGPVEQGAVTALNAGLDPNRSSGELVQTASNLLAQITYQTGIVTVPKPAASQLRQIEFLPLSGDRVLVILVINEREVQNRIIQMQRPMDEEQLKAAADLINQRYAGNDLSQVQGHIVREMSEARARIDRNTVDREGHRAVGGDGRGHRRGGPAAYERGRRCPDADRHRAVGGEGGGQAGERAHPFEQVVPLVEQCGLIVAAAARPREPQVHPREFCAIGIHVPDVGFGVETQAIADRGEAAGGDVELACERFGFGKDGGTPRAVGRVRRKLLQRGLELDDRGEDARLLDGGFDVLQAGELDIGALQIGLGAAHLGLAEGVGIAADLGHTRTRCGDIATATRDGSARDLLDPDTAAHVAVARGIGDVVRRNLERAARRAGAARADGEQIRSHLFLCPRHAVLRKEARKLALDRIGETQLS